MDHAIIICDMQYLMGYGSHECNMQCKYGMGCANAIWAARKQYAIREYAIGRANAICAMRIRYGSREYDMQY